MKTKRSARWGLLAGAAAGVMALAGCELLVNFDRSEIPTGDASTDDGSEFPTDGQVPPADGASDGSTAVTDAGAPDGTAPADAGDGGGSVADTGTSDTGAADTGAADTGASVPDAGVDAAMEASVVLDAGPDATDAANPDM
jgi:hypothetical protein